MMMIRVMLRQVMLAGRDIGMFVGMLTMGATWVGGGFINGSAQEAYKAGLIWTQAPFGYGLSLFISESLILFVYSKSINQYFNEVNLN